MFDQLNLSGIFFCQKLAWFRGFLALQIAFLCKTRHRFPLVFRALSRIHDAAHFAFDRHGNYSRHQEDTSSDQTGAQGTQGDPIRRTSQKGNTEEAGGQA